MPTPQKLIRVDNTETRLLEFPKDAGAGILPLRLAPGGNNVPADTIAKLEAGKGKRGLVKGWRDAVARGAVKVHSVADSQVLVRKPVGVDAPASLLDRSVKAAIQIVKVTSDVDVLEMWAGKEGARPKVAEAISARLMELGAA